MSTRNKFAEIMDRHLETSRSGEMERQAHGMHHRRAEGAGYSSSPRAVRRRTQKRMGR